MEFLFCFGTLFKFIKYVYKHLECGFIILFRIAKSVSVCFFFPN